MAMKGDAKSLSFVEDTAVAPEQLRDYIDRFLRIVSRHGTSAGVYAAIEPTYLPAYLQFLYYPF